MGGKKKRNKALDSQRQKVSALRYRGIDAFMQTGVGISG